MGPKKGFTLKLHNTFILGTYSIPAYIPEHAIESFQLMDQEILNSDSHAIFRKSSPFLLKYNKLVQRFKECGLIYPIVEQVSYFH